MHRPVYVNQITLPVLIKALLTGASCEALADVTGLHVKTVRRYIKQFRKHDVVFRCAVEPDTRGHMRRAVYRLKLTRFEKDVGPELSDATLERHAGEQRRLRRQAGVGE